MNALKQQVLLEVGEKARNLKMDEEITLPEVDGFAITFDDVVNHMTQFHLFDVEDHSEHGDMRPWAWLDNESEAGNVRRPICLIISVDGDDRVNIRRSDWLDHNHQLVTEGNECPTCDTANIDLLVWQGDEANDGVLCQTCGTRYVPGEQRNVVEVETMYHYTVRAIVTEVAKRLTGEELPEERVREMALELCGEYVCPNCGDDLVQVEPEGGKWCGNCDHAVGMVHPYV